MHTQVAVNKVKLHFKVAFGKYGRAINKKIANLNQDLAGMGTEIVTENCKKISS